MRRGPLALSAASVALILLVAASCGDDAAGIEVAEVGRADVVELVDAPASVAASAAATLTAVADGTIAELRVGPGAEVTAGEVLAVVDSPAAQRRLEQADEARRAAGRAAVTVPVGDLAGTQAATDLAAGQAFDQARAVADRVADEELRAALQAQVDAAQAQYEAAARAARAAVRAVQQGVASLGSAVAALGAAQQVQAEQAYELAKATVDELTLRAPFDGMVQLGGVTADAAVPDGLAGLLGATGVTGGVPELPAEAPPGVDPVPAPGGLVRAGMPVVTVVDVSPLGLVAEVDETDVLLVEPGETAAEVELDALPGARYQATVTAVDLLPTPSPRGGVAYRVRLTLGEGTLPGGATAPAPRPGMSAVAHLRVREAAGAVAVPAAAVRRVGDVDVVWTVADGRARQTPVTLGVQGPDLVEILDGIRPGDRIVVSGADQVTEGQRLP